MDKVAQLTSAAHIACAKMMSVLNIMSTADYVDRLEKSSGEDSD